MIPVRVHVQLEELSEQYFPGLQISQVNRFPFDDETWDVYTLEMEDDRTYWIFDDQQELSLLSNDGIFADVETALEAIQQMRENSREIKAQALRDRSDFY